MANTILCGKCKFYDTIIRGAEKETKRGWCMKRSKYPFREGPGQVFPEGVERVDVGQLAVPFIVRGKQVFPGCPYAAPAAFDQAEQKREAQKKGATRDTEGKRLLS
jgi:hypothetical protein